MTFRWRNSQPAQQPGSVRLLTSYWHCLENMLLSPHDLTRREELSQAVDTLQTFLRHYRRKAGLPDGAEMQMDFVFDSEIEMEHPSQIW